jgi:LPXTG-motif cell wall-anchored protein
MDEPTRRRPRSRPPAPPGPPGEPPGEGPFARRSPFGIIGLVALVVVVAVVVVAFATGTSDDLPWGAIIGVLLILAVAWGIGRRRAALHREEDEEG